VREIFIKALEEVNLKIGDESEYVVVTAQFEDIPSVWMKLFEGGNAGKLMGMLGS
jgi:NADPH-dependent curcumin reductase CurA